jgi:hypothetical protein
MFTDNSGGLGNDEVRATFTYRAGVLTIPSFLVASGIK